MTQFPEIRAWHVQNALVSAGMYVHDERHLYSDSSWMGHFHGPRQSEVERDLIAEQFAQLGPMPRNDDYAAEQVLVFHNEANATWGHFLIQSFPRALLFAERFPDARIAVPVPYTVPGSSHADSFLAYGIGPDRLIGVRGDVCYRFGEAIIVDFMFTVEGGIHPMAQDLLTPRGQTPAAQRVPSTTFVRRLVTASRAIVNQVELDAVLDRHGITSHAVGAMSFAEQVAVFENHDLIIGTLGSDLTNLVFAPPGSSVLVLSPDWFEDDFFYKLAASRGVQWHEIRCGELGAPGHHPNWSSFHVDPELVDAALTTLLQ